MEGIKEALNAVSLTKQASFHTGVAIYGSGAIVSPNRALISSGNITLLSCAFSIFFAYCKV